MADGNKVKRSFIQPSVTSKFQVGSSKLLHILLNTYIALNTHLNTTASPTKNYEKLPDNIKTHISKINIQTYKAYKDNREISTGTVHENDTHDYSIASHHILVPLLGLKHKNILKGLMVVTEGRAKNSQHHEMLKKMKGM